MPGDLRLVALLFVLGPVIMPAAAAPDEPDGPVLDEEFLRSSRWDDGKAEIAFFRVEVDWDYPPEPWKQSYVTTAVLVKHDYDEVELQKVTDEGDHVVPAFQGVSIYEVGQYRNRLSRAFNARQSDLRPLKQTMTSISWEGSSFREFAFFPDGTVEVLARSDTTRTPNQRLSMPLDSFAIAQIPLLVRALDFDKRPRQVFKVLDLDGNFVEVTAERSITERLETQIGEVLAERIEVRHAEPRLLVGALTNVVAPREIYWRRAGGNRQIVRIEAPKFTDGSYRIELVEEIRSTWWREDIRPLLERVDRIP